MIEAQQDKIVVQDSAEMDVVLGTKLLARAVETKAELGQPVIDLCAAVIDHVYALRGDLKPATGALKAELVERHRKTLTKRYELILNGKRELKRLSNPALAVLMVDAAVTEIFT